jgi:uncharacterized HAD superfamily protein
LIFTYKKHFPSHKVIEPITSFSIQNFFPIKEEIYNFFLENAGEIFYKNSPIIKDADRGMKYLHRLGYELNIVTSQKEETLEPTIKWLKKHKIKFDHLYNTEDKHLVDAYDIHVDDDPKQIANIINAGKKVIIFSTEQNKKIDKHIERKCIRIKNWNELIELFEDISKVESHIKNFISWPTK